MVVLKSSVLPPSNPFNAREKYSELNSESADDSLKLVKLPSQYALAVPDVIAIVSATAGDSSARISEQSANAC